MKRCAEDSRKSTKFSEETRKEQMISVRRIREIRDAANELTLSQDRLFAMSTSLYDKLSS